MTTYNIDLTEEEKSIIIKEHNIEFPQYSITAFTEDEDPLEVMDAFDEVSSEFIKGGRWTNYRSTVYKVTEDLYIEVYNELPATEIQDGCDFTCDIYRVYPYAETITKYKRI